MHNKIVVKNELLKNKIAKNRVAKSFSMVLYVKKNKKINVRLSTNMEIILDFLPPELQQPWRTSVIKNENFSVDFLQGVEKIKCMGQ